MYLITKSYRFEAAHRLISPYVGKCNSIHGHSFRVTLHLSAAKLDESSMVADFSSFKPISEWINKNLDHATLVSKADSDLIGWLIANGQKHFVMDGNPTSEVIAKLVYDQAERLGFELAAVRVAETCTSAAKFYPTNHNQKSGD